MRTALVIAVASLAALGAAPALHAATKPRPVLKWYWTADKTEKRLVASNPALGTSEPGTIFAADCAGKGKARSGRFVSFACSVKWGTQAVGIGGAYTYRVFVKIRPTRSGKLCAARDSFAAIDPACIAV